MNNLHFMRNSEYELLVNVPTGIRDNKLRLIYMLTQSYKYRHQFVGHS